MRRALAQSVTTPLNRIICKLNLGEEKIILLVLSAPKLKIFLFLKNNKTIQLCWVSNNWIKCKQHFLWDPGLKPSWSREKSPHTSAPWGLILLSCSSPSHAHLTHNYTFSQTEDQSEMADFVLLQVKIIIWFQQEERPLHRTARKN